MDDRQQLEAGDVAQKEGRRRQDEQVEEAQDQDVCLEALRAQVDRAQVPTGWSWSSRTIIPPS